MARKNDNLIISNGLETTEDEKTESSQTFFIDTNFKKFLKYYAVTHEITIKDVITNALKDQYGKDFEEWKKIVLTLSKKI
ncbi:MAG: hypothetical protein LBP34_03500 [Flavobacteriaceae bacterium]|jgi:hypothetical protein|nr:hypothetical protein [Flavobacteriaceae bacterium]